MWAVTEQQDESVVGRDGNIGQSGAAQIGVFVRQEVVAGGDGLARGIEDLHPIRGAIQEGWPGKAADLGGGELMGLMGIDSGKAGIADLTDHQIRGVAFQFIRKVISVGIMQGG